jgi:holliday junction DNA helicase RuvB
MAIDQREPIAEDLIGEEPKIPESVRPNSLAKYIGQSQAKDTAEILIQDALSRCVALGHMMFVGPPGLGKTTLSHAIGHEVGTTTKTISGKALSKKTDLQEILLDLGPREILFIDELHCLPPGMAEVLYKPLEDYKLDIIVEQKIRTMPLKPFTLIGATTRDDLVPAPLRSRFHINIHFEFYEPEELALIIRNAAEILNIPIDEDGALEIARRSQGTPRTANLLLLWARAYANVRAAGTVTLAVARAALEKRRVDEQGLDEVSRNFMLTIIKKHRGGPVGVSTLAAALSTNKGTIEERYEPFLMRLGLLDRTNLGRVATDAAYEYFKNELTPDAKLRRRVRR